MSVIAAAQITISKISDGINGTDKYVWIRYADDANGGGRSNLPGNKKYLGIAYNKDTPTESDNPEDYQWSLFLGPQGIEGPRGETGSTTYTWIKYADTASGAGIGDSSNGKKYIGIAYNKATPNTTSNPADYQWSLFQGPQGIQGPRGEDAPTLYTWIKYADTATGEGMSDNPSGKKYIGFAYNKTSSTESSTASDYSWALIKGEQGVRGPAGADGQTTYTWIRYSNNADGSNMTADSTDKKYIGLAYNKTSSTPSTNPADYTWSLFQGPQGVQGPKGEDAPPNYTWIKYANTCLLYTSPSPRDATLSRMPSSA